MAIDQVALPISLSKIELTPAADVIHSKLMCWKEMS